jgi:hypothetical protein
MKKYILPIFIIVLFIPLTLSGEDYFHILSGKGSPFTLIREDVRRELDPVSSDLTDILLGEGDYLLTGEGTFLELSCGGILIMVGENSALSIDSLDLEQGSLLTLNYGHIHGRMDYNGAGDLWIGGVHSAARLNGGEIGVLTDYEVTLDQPEFLMRVYSLDGTIEVMQKLEQITVDEEKRIEYSEPLIIDKGEMVVASSWKREKLLFPSLFDSDYLRYWENHPFSDETAQQIAVIELPSEEKLVVTEEIQENIDPERERWESVTETGQAALVLGAISMAGGALSYMGGYGELGNIFTKFGLFNLTVGSGIYSYVYFGNPAYRTEKN